MDHTELTKYILEKFPGKIELLDTGKAEPFFKISADFLLDFCRSIHSDEKLFIDFLCNIGAVDTGKKFEVVYSVASVKNHIRFDFKLEQEYEGAEIDSIQEIWAGANWHEREVWELYGINIRNHGNLTRFLLPDDWNQGFPMRKNWDAPDFVRMPEQ
jgi:NADH:ubiquinone oxidoreductase subunit C